MRFEITGSYNYGYIKCGKLQVYRFGIKGAIELPFLPYVGMSLAIPFSQLGLYPSDRRRKAPPVRGKLSMLQVKMVTWSVTKDIGWLILTHREQ